MKTVSVIMPLYNVESCMTDAVRSVLAQTYPHLELILVDDGSPDRSGAIADKFAAEYPDRVRVIHQENQGQGGARNTGVAAAVGDYLLFVDSDDHIVPDLLETCVALAEDHTADVTVFEHDIVRPDGTRVKTVRSPYNFPPFGDVRVDRRLLLVAGMPWNKLFRTDFYRSCNLAFPQKVWYEDFILCTKLMAQARRIAYTDRPLYRYYLRAGSTMRNHNTERNLEILSAMDDILDYFRTQQLDTVFADELCCLAIDNVYITTALRLLRIDPKTPLIGTLRQYMKTRFPHYSRNPYLSQMTRQYRLTFRLLERRMPWLIALLTRVKDRIQQTKKG